MFNIIDRDIGFNSLFEELSCNNLKLKLCIKIGLWFLLFIISQKRKKFNKREEAFPSWTFYHKLSLCCMRIFSIFAEFICATWSLFAQNDGTYQRIVLVETLFFYVK